MTRRAALLTIAALLVVWGVVAMAVHGHPPAMLAGHLHLAQDHEQADGHTADADAQPTAADAAGPSQDARTDGPAPGAAATTPGVAGAALPDTTGAWILLAAVLRPGDVRPSRSTRRRGPPRVHDGDGDRTGTPVSRRERLLV